MVIFSWKDIQDNLFSNFFSKSESAITVGVFDGIHPGHQMLLGQVLSEKGKRLAGIVTFNDRIFSLKKTSEKPIRSLEDRLSTFNHMGFDFVILLDFTNDIKDMDGIEFLFQLKNKCNMRSITEGEDFNLGKGGKVGINEIRSFCEGNDIKCTFIPPVMYKGQRISSSYIRDLINKKELKEAESLISMS